MQWIEGTCATRSGRRIVRELKRNNLLRQVLSPAPICTRLALDCHPDSTDMCIPRPNTKRRGGIASSRPASTSMVSISGSNRVNPPRRQRLDARRTQRSLSLIFAVGHSSRAMHCGRAGVGPYAGGKICIGGAGSSRRPLHLVKCRRRRGPGPAWRRPPSHGEAGDCRRSPSSTRRKFAWSLSSLEGAAGRSPTSTTKRGRARKVERPSSTGREGVSQVANGLQVRTR